MKKTLIQLFAAIALGSIAACSGAEAASSAAGIYELDKAVMKETMLAMMPAETRSKPEAVEMAAKAVDGMNVIIDLHADGTAKLDAKMDVMGQKVENSAAGTWKFEAGKLTIITKDENGKEGSKTADLVDGKFSMEMGQGGQKMKMNFVRKK
jgi:heat shock protein HslJ